MLKTAVFRGLDAVAAKKIINYLGARTEKCNTTETIMSYNGNLQDVGIMLSGSAELAAYDYDGNKTILERYNRDSLFGQMFAPAFVADELSVSATSKCEFLLFRYNKLTSVPEGDIDRSYNIFMNNIMQLMTATLRTRANHLAVLGKRGLRGKLRTYFALAAADAGSASFTLPFSLYALADFLGVDRSAMQREMKKMREEGIIDSKGKKITLLIHK